ncbi:hypothetical protein IscW_ISCW006122, partial [Ixodes scapularis]
GFRCQEPPRGVHGAPARWLHYCDGPAICCRCRLGARRASSQSAPQQPGRRAGALPASASLSEEPRRRSPSLRAAGPDGALPAATVRTPAASDRSGEVSIAEPGAVALASRGGRISGPGQFVERPSRMLIAVATPGT